LQVVFLYRKRKAKRLFAYVRKDSIAYPFRLYVS